MSQKTDPIPPGPTLSGVGQLDCSSASPTCTDIDALAGTSTLFYQALSACGPGAAEEGPVN